MLTGWSPARPERAASRTLHQHFTSFRVCGSEIECSLNTLSKAASPSPNPGNLPTGETGCRRAYRLPRSPPHRCRLQGQAQKQHGVFNKQSLSLWKDLPYGDLSYSLCFLQGCVPAFSEAMRSGQPPVRPAEMYRQSSPIPSETLPL